MTKKRIEVCREKTTADRRAQWMKERGYEVDGPTSLEKVMWDARDVTGNTDVASDDDDEVWLVVGKK